MCIHTCHVEYFPNYRTTGMICQNPILGPIMCASGSIESSDYLLLCHQWTIPRSLWIIPFLIKYLPIISWVITPLLADFYPEVTCSLANIYQL